MAVARVEVEAEILAQRAAIEELHHNRHPAALHEGRAEKVADARVAERPQDGRLSLDAPHGLGRGDGMEDFDADL